MGTGRTESDIVRLERQGKQYIRERQGLTNDLFEDEDELKIICFVSSISNSHLQVIGPELVFGTLYDLIGYNQIGNEILRHLAITRLFNPE